MMKREMHLLRWVPDCSFHDDAHNAFMTLPRYTSTRKDDVQAVVERAIRHPTQNAMYIIKTRERREKKAIFVFVCSTKGVLAFSRALTAPSRFWVMTALSQVYTVSCQEIEEEQESNRKEASRQILL